MIATTKVKDCVIFQNKIHMDNRGCLGEIYKKSSFFEFEIEQAYCSKSKKGVVRGLHINNFAKLIVCVRGAIFDVVVDTRLGSPTFKELQVSIFDSPDRAVYVPAGCAHGFMAIESKTEIVCMQGGSYDPVLERVLLWNDPELGINWPLQDAIVSEKDQKGIPFSEMYK